MRNTKVALLLVILTLGLAGSVSAASLTETIDKTFDVRPGAQVSLTNVNGSVTVTAWDQPRVKVRAIKEVDASRDQLKEIMAELRVEMQPRDGGLVVTTNYPKPGQGGIGSLFHWILGGGADAQVKYELMVPRTMNVWKCRIRTARSA